VTETTKTASTSELIDTYFAMWRETDDAARNELLAQVFVPDGRHVDQLADAVGYDAIGAVVAGVHAHYPGFTIERTSAIDQHGAQLRFAWRLDAADGSTVVTGLDVGELAADGRLARIAGFWGDLPAG
jgi:hypothetical protein